MKSGIGIASILLLATMIFTPAAHAQPYGAPPPGAYPGRRAMHRRMIAACKHKTMGSPCVFAAEKRTYSGTCFKARHGYLVCHAKGMWGRHVMHRHYMGGMMPPGNPPPQ
jgi:hypothetical protein